MSTYKTIAETNSFIVLDQYTKWNECHEANAAYQTEAALEREFVEDLIHQGYEGVQHITTQEAMYDNVRTQIERLNNTHFSNSEWNRFCTEYLDNPSDTQTDKSRKLQDEYIYDFTFDDGHLQNIYLVDKKDITRNRLQVLTQFEQTGAYANRYDVTILVNGLPLVQVELKKRGVAIREAFNQVHRYSKESFNSEHSLFKYLQVFVISNGTDTRYFANTTRREKNSFDFTMNWAKADNTLIKDLKDFTATFFQRHTLLQILLTYSIFDVNKTLLIMRPYQIAATERILWKIRTAYETRQHSCPEGGGYIWHTTGSGKTLTSFKAAQLATALPFIDKVFFVVDRKDLDYQTIKEYQRFSPDSVNGSESTAGLKRNIERNDNKIIVTTIQKLNNLMKSEANLPIYGKHVVFIFDECHRSQFGEAQKNLKKKFKLFYQFGFTGTPIFTENALGSETTASVFGRELHSYVITDAIRDEKVLKFKVDYNNVRPRFRRAEQEQDELQLTSAAYQKLLLHPERIREISEYILTNFRLKTHRLEGGARGFNAMFAVSSVEAAKLYYEELNRQQSAAKRPLRIATIFSFAPNEEQQAAGEIVDESFEPSAMDMSSKEFLSKAIQEYNHTFGTSYDVDSQSFQNYYRDLSQRVKNGDVDLLIVVGMFLTGFDAPRLNTLFVDKNLRYHGLIQAYSRTNRIYNSTKTFGNIITFRDLEQATVNAISLFGDRNTQHVLLERSFKEYLEGFKDIVTGEVRKGYIEVVQMLDERYPHPDVITTEKEKKDFVKLFGEYLKVENILQNYDEFSALKAFQQIDRNDAEAVDRFREKYFLSEEQIEQIQHIKVLPDRLLQDYRSTYNDIREWIRREREGKRPEEQPVDWEDVVFEVDLLKSQEIDLDYILELILERHKTRLDKEALVDEARRLIRSNLGNRAKEELIVDFIHTADLDQIEDKTGIIEAFFTYAQERQRNEAAALIESEGLNEEAAKRYITNSLRREYASENGTELKEILPKMSPLKPEFLTKKKHVFARIVEFVEKFKGIGGKL